MLAYALVIRVYAEFEQQVTAIIAEKSASIENVMLRKTFDATIKDKYRGILSSSLSELIEAFGDEYKADFRDKRLNNQKAETFYNNIITNRRDPAHRAGPSVTFTEIKSFYEEGHIILDFFQETLLSIDDKRLPD